MSIEFQYLNMLIGQLGFPLSRKFQTKPTLYNLKLWTRKRRNYLCFNPFHCTFYINRDVFLQLIEDNLFWILMISRFGRSIDQVSRILCSALPGPAFFSTRLFKYIIGPKLVKSTIAQGKVIYNLEIWYCYIYTTSFHL